MGLYSFKTFKVRSENLGCPQLVDGLIERCRQYDSSEMEPLSRTGTVLGKRLQKIDYIDYVERSGRNTLAYLLENQDRVNDLCQELRTQLSVA